MGNAKCENMFKHVQNNVANASSLTGKICLLLAIQTFNLVSKRPTFFASWLWTSFLGFFFCLKTSVSLFCSGGLLYFYMRVTS